MAKSHCLVVMARYPRRGRSKTRLIPALGRRGAAELHRRMAGHTLLTARQAACEQEIDLCVYGTGARPGRFRRWLGQGPRYRRQIGQDLGQRMARAFAAQCVRHDRVVIIGTDCPNLTPAIIGEAFALLDNHELVVGPAADGGYYLIGLKHPVPELFERITWGGKEVLQQTLTRAQKLDLGFARLPVLHDVDRPEDLPVWEAAGGTAEHHSSGFRLSVIIPALNEADSIGAVLDRVRADAHETIVVDGGSEDETRTIAYGKGARVLSAPRNRACQMNVGAQAATGNVLLFLHADTMLPSHYAVDVQRTLLRRTAAGAFRFRLDGQRRAWRVVEWGTRWRARLSDLPYGDQALFMRSDRFRAMGGFAIIPLMENFELVCRLRRQGRIRLTPRAAVTSARRWSRRGALRTTGINQLIIWGYRLGVAPRHLAAFYDKPR